MFSILRFLGSLFAPVIALLNSLRWLWVGLLVIGLPLFIYFTFVADEPVFTVENDVGLGRQSEASIAADPEEYPLLSRQDYPEAYAHLDRIVGKVVRSPVIEHGDLFAYDDVKIIHDDDVLNAFCTPGGFVYVYTGLVHYLDAEDHLAGVLGHEIAHAERRHSSTRLQREFGAQRLPGVRRAHQPDDDQRCWDSSHPQGGGLTHLQPCAGSGVRRLLGPVPVFQQLCL